MSTGPTLRYDDRVRARFPTLATATLEATLDGASLARLDLEPLVQQGRDRLAGGTESELAEIRAWRQAFTAMGLKATRYRCASEALLRRLRTTGSLPRVNPLVDLCNAVSAAFALPVAALDRDRFTAPLTVRPADGTEPFEALGGDVEQPAPGEIAFVDADGRAHARRWTHRQSGRSAVTERTRRVLVVCEGLHETAGADVERAVARLARMLRAAGAGLGTEPGAERSAREEADPTSSPTGPRRSA